MAVMMDGVEFDPPTPRAEPSKTDLSDGLELMECLIHGLERYRRQLGTDVVPNLLDAEVAVTFREDTKDG
jgi:hypothetical protein